MITFMLTSNTHTQKHTCTHTHTHTQSSAKPESIMTVDASETLCELEHHLSPLETPVSYSFELVNVVTMDCMRKKI